MKGLTGLANVGNTCYLNSCIQIISNTVELNKFLDNKPLRLNKKNESVIFDEWNQLRKMMWDKNCVIVPRGFINNVKNISQLKSRELFGGSSQNDLQEFYLFLLECFHAGISREVDMEISGFVVNDTDKLAKSCYQMMIDMYKNEYSEIIDIFYGIHVSAICDLKSDKYISIKPEPFTVISLPIPDKKTVSIMECFESYCADEVLDGENEWFNDKTNKKQPVKRKILFWSLPKVLMVDLKRWDIMGNKKNTLVTSELTKLDMRKFVHGYTKETCIYELYGVCNHMGNMFGGHYTAFVRKEDKWFEFNDTRIRELNAKQIITPMSYCLFYRKKITE